MFHQDQPSIQVSLIDKHQTKHAHVAMRQLCRINGIIHADSRMTEIAATDFVVSVLNPLKSQHKEYKNSAHKHNTTLHSYTFTRTHMHTHTHTVTRTRGHARAYTIASLIRIHQRRASKSKLCKQFPTIYPKYVILSCLWKIIEKKTERASYFG